MAGFEELPYFNIENLAEKTRLQSFIEYLVLENKKDTVSAKQISQSILRSSILNWNTSVYFSVSRLIKQLAVEDSEWIPIHLYYDAWFSFMNGNVEKSIEKYFRCEKEFVSLGLMEDADETKISIARVFHSIGKWQLAIEYYEKAISSLTSSSSNRARAKAFALHSLSDIYLQQLNIIKAEQYSMQAVKLVCSNNEASLSFGIFTALRNLGNIYRIKGDWDKALSFYKQSIQSSIKNNNKGEEAHTLNCVATTYLKLGKLSLSKQNIQKSMEIHNQLEDQVWSALDLALLGEISVFESDFNNAQNYYNQAIEILKNIDKRLLVSVTGKKVYCLILTKDYLEAKRILSECRKLIDGLPERKISAFLNELEGINLYCLRNFNASLNLLNKCLEVYTEAKIIYKQVDVLLLISKVYKSLDPILEREFSQKASILASVISYDSPYLEFDIQ